jgi:hypothetical protein
MPTYVTPREEESLNQIAKKIRALREFLNEYDLPADRSRLDGWLTFLNLTKGVLGNFNNDISFVATLLAKMFLVNAHPGLDFDVASKSQSAPGLDIDVRLPPGSRIIGEVKTVEPYKENDFGSQQRDAFKRDFVKLSKAAADYKYLFLTQPRAFEVVSAKYRQWLSGVTVVCLADGRKFTA